MNLINEKNVDFFALVLLAIATLFSSLGAFFQNDFWGKMTQNYIESIHTFWKATTEYSDALSDIQWKSLDNLKDDLLYYEWQNQVWVDDTEAEYLFSRLSEGLQKDIEMSDTEDDGTGSYFEQQDNEMVEEIEAKIALYEEGMLQAEETLKIGSRYNSKGDKMTLVTILMTIALFIGWLCSSSSIAFYSRKYFLIAGYLIFALSIIVFIQWLIL